MPLIFARMSHFPSKLFFGPKIPLMFIFIVIRVHSVKKVTTRSTGNLVACEVLNGDFNDV